MLNTYVKFKELLNKVTNKVPMKNTSASNVNCNDYTETGVYYLGSSVTNAPEDYCKLLVMGTSSGKGDTFQLATGITSGKMYSRTGRTKSGTFTWSNWEEYSKETTLWSGNSAGGNTINVDVNGYKRLRVKVRMSGIIDFLEIDLNIQTISIEKNGTYYKYGNSVAAGAMDGTQYLNKASVAVSGDKTKVIGYGFGYSSLANGWNFQDRDSSTDVWGVLEIVGIK